MYSNVYISVNNFFSFIKIPILSYINNYFIKIRKKKKQEAVWRIWLCNQWYGFSKV